MPDADTNTLEHLNRGYLRAVEARDATWFDAHLSPDFMNTNPDGTLVDRAAFLAYIAAGAGVSDVQGHDILIRVMGDLAIIHARTSYVLAGTPGGGRYTDIYQRRDGQWLCVGAHVMRC